MVDVADVTEYAATLPNVVHAENTVYTCSADSLEADPGADPGEGLNRVIVSSCTPRTHEPIFRDTIREAGLNPYLFEMANIRDQDSWVHAQWPELATQKAEDLTRMAVARARRLEPLYTQDQSLSHRALVIGGGVAGMTAALNLADQGYDVTLVEREQELGGQARNLSATGDGGDVQAFLARSDRPCDRPSAHRGADRPPGGQIERLCGQFRDHGGHAAPIRRSASSNMA